jgi:hypothetical protein
MDRRPYPVAPSSGVPIPMVSITNSFTPSEWGNPTSNQASDQAVPTLSQDMGFAYPDFAKAGSHVRLHFTGVTHMDVGPLKNVDYGPNLTWDLNTATGYDALKNRAYRDQMKTTLSRLLLGFASHQASFILNDGQVGANADEIQAQYTHTVYENGGNYRIQNGTNGVQGNISRLKGADKRIIRKPVVLPYDYDSKSFYVNSALSVQSDEELFLPAGSTLDMRAGGSITVMSGGVFTIGGTPVFASSKAANRTVTIKGADYLSVPITFAAGAKVRVPNPQAGIAYRLVFAKPSATVVLRVGSKGSVDDYNSNDLYAGSREICPYVTRRMSSSLSFGQDVYPPSALNAAGSLLTQ